MLCLFALTGDASFEICLHTRYVRLFSDKHEMYMYLSRFFNEFLMFCLILLWASIIFIYSINKYETETESYTMRKHWENILSIYMDKICFNISFHFELAREVTTALKRNGFQ